MKAEQNVSGFEGKRFVISMSIPRGEKPDRGIRLKPHTVVSLDRSQQDRSLKIKPNTALVIGQRLNESQRPGSVVSYLKEMASRSVSLPDLVEKINDDLGLEVPSESIRNLLLRIGVRIQPKVDDVVPVSATQPVEKVTPVPSPAKAVEPVGPSRKRKKRSPSPSKLDKLMPPGVSLKEFLVRHYVELEMSARQIAALLTTPSVKTKEGVVQHHLVKYGLIRTQSEAVKLSWKNRVVGRRRVAGERVTKMQKLEKLLPAGMTIETYLREGRLVRNASSEVLARELSIYIPVSTYLVSSWIRKFDLPVAKRKEKVRNSSSHGVVREAFEAYKMTNSSDHPNVDAFIIAEFTSGEKLASIAKKLQVNPSSLYAYLNADVRKEKFVGVYERKPRKKLSDPEGLSIVQRAVYDKFSKPGQTFKEMLADAYAKSSIRDLELQWKVTDKSILVWLKDAGIDIMYKNSDPNKSRERSKRKRQKIMVDKLGVDPKSSIILMLQSNKSFTSIAEDLKLNPQTLRSWMRDVGLDPEIYIKKNKNKLNSELVNAAYDAMLVSSLPQRQQGILYYRYMSSPTKSFQELADIYKISKQRIEQIEKAALEKLRQYTGHAVAAGDESDVK